MQLPPALVAQLRHLTDTEEPQGDPLPEVLDDLAVGLALAVGSLLAVTVTVMDGTVPVSVVMSAHGSAARKVMSSLIVRLPGSPGGTLTIVAGSAGALDQLGADLPALLDIHRDRVEMDTVFTMPPDDPENGLGEDLADASTVNQAVGALLEGGMLPADGLGHLQQLAAREETTVPEQARRVLRAARRATGD